MVAIGHEKRGRSSVVERHVANVNVVSSSLIARFYAVWLTPDDRSYCSGPADGGQVAVRLNAPFFRDCSVATSAATVSFFFVALSF